MTQFGRYTILQRIGVGGMAEVFKAKIEGPSGFEKTLALKKVLSDLAETPSFVEMFVQEAKLAGELTHPNIVQVFDFGRVEKDYFLAMEYVPGANLERVMARLLQAGAWLPLQTALYLVAEACKGLGYAHTKTDAFGNPLGVVHRDISPQNLLISYGGDVKIADFGIAKVAGTIQRTAVGEIRGKVAYMSPEQVRGESATLDGRTDLFCLGLILYELIAKRRLFMGISSMELFAALASFQGPTEAQLDPIPPPIRPILSTLLHPTVEWRFRSAAALETALTAVMGAEGMLEGRRALAGIVQHLFDEERRLEMSGGSTPGTPSPMPGGAPAASGFSASPAPGFSASPASPGFTASPAPGPAVYSSGGQQDIVSHEKTTISDPARPRPVQPPEEKDKTGSGLTLAPSAVAVKQPTRTITRSIVIPRKTGTTRKPRRGRRVFLLAGVLALAGSSWGAINYLPALRPLKTALLAGMPAATSTSTPDGAMTQASAGTPSVPGASPASTRKTPSPKKTPRPKGTPAAGGVATTEATGKLFVRADPPAEVWIWIDGERAATSPLEGQDLPAGVHTIRLVNTAAGFDAELFVEIPAGGKATIVGDPKNRTIRQEP